MKYYWGHWQWTTEKSGESYFAPPPGAIGAIDLGLVPQMAVAGVDRPGCFCYSNDSLPSEYTLLGEGDVREITVNAKMKSALASQTGYSPKGDRLCNLVADVLTAGADPSGLDNPYPIMPTQEGTVDLWMPGHGRVLSQAFKWGDPYTAKIKPLLRSTIAGLVDDAEAGKLRDVQHPRRVLDAYCDKFKLQGEEEWKEFVPLALQAKIEGRLKHETTYSDNFNRANSTGLGAGWTTLLGSGHDVFSNQARANATTTSGTQSRYDSDLSSSDMYSEVTLVSFGSNPTFITAIGVIVRCHSSAHTNYLFNWRVGVNPTRRMQKYISGVATQLTNDNVLPPSLSFVGRLSVVSSLLKAYENGSEITGLTTTDTSTPGNLRAGIHGQNNSPSLTISDGWSCGDNASAVPLAVFHHHFRSQGII